MKKHWAIFYLCSAVFLIRATLYNHDRAAIHPDTLSYEISMGEMWHQALRPPLYILFRNLESGNRRLIVYDQALMSALMLWVMLRKTKSWAAVWFLFFEPLGWCYPQFILTETMFTLLFMLAVMGEGAAAGLWMTLATLTRTLTGPPSPAGTRRT